MEKDEYNFYSFWQSDQDDSLTKLKCLKFNEEVLGEYVDEGNEIGYKYQILLVRDHKEDPEKFADMDFFEAILAHPITYIRQLCATGWYGIVVRKSEKSIKFIDTAVAELQELL